MELILYTCEEMDATLAHGAFLCTPEQADEYYLMHWRTKGSKNGQRRYQDTEGRLTPEGYRHYAEMYGWNRRLNKISRIQNKADRLTNKAAKADIKAAKAKVKSDKAERDANATTRRAILNPGQSRNTEMDNAILDVARMENLKYQSKQNKADSLHVKADRASKTAARLANKMEKKEDRIMSKIEKKLDESQLENAKNFASELAKSGLADKAIMNTVSNMDAGRTKISQKSDLAIRDSITGLGRIVKEDPENHSYITSVNVGKGVEAQVEIKRNGKNVDITAYAEEGLIKRGLAGKAVEKVKAAIEGYDKDARAEEKVGKRIENNPYIEGTRAFKENAAMYDKLDRFDSLSKDEQRQVGDQLLKKLGNYDKVYGSFGSKAIDELNDTDAEHKRDADREFERDSNWLIQTISNKVGSINAGDYRPGSDAAKAQEKADESWMRADERREQVRKDIGYQNDSSYGKKYQAEQKRLAAALEKDSVWKKLDAQWERDQKDVMGAILKDLGFSDTPQNRSILWAYGWFD